MSESPPSSTPESASVKPAKRSLFRNKPEWAKVDRDPPTQKSRSSNDFFSGRSRQSLEKLEEERREQKRKDQEAAAEAKRAEEEERISKKQKRENEQPPAQVSHAGGLPTPAEDTKNGEWIAHRDVPMPQSNPVKTTPKSMWSRPVPKVTTPSPLPKPPIDVQILDDDNSTNEDVTIVEHPKAQDQPSQTPTESINQKPPDDVVMLDEDPLVKESRERLRREREAQEASISLAPHDQPPEPGYGPVIKIFIHSQLPNTNPLIINRRIGQRLKEVRKIWCERQGFTDSQADAIFLTWRRLRLYDTSTCQGLGVTVDAAGEVLLKGKLLGTREGANLEMEAMTMEMFEAEKKEREAGGKPSEASKEPPQPPKKRIKTILTAPGYEDYKLIVNEDTTFARVVRTFRTQREVPEEQTIFLVFDGERLEDDMQVKDTEISDMDNIEVHIRD